MQSPDMFVKPVPRPGLLYRLGLGGFSLLMMACALRFLDLDPLSVVDLSLLLPVLLSWGTLLLTQYHELRGIELHLRRKPARTSLSASRQALRNLWRHTWQFGLLLVLINGVGTLQHIQDINRSGHFTATLLIGLIYLLILKGGLVLPLEIALARRAEELA